MGKYLNKQVYSNIDDVDVILMLVDGSQELGSGDKYIIEKIKEKWRLKTDAFFHEYLNI